MTTKSKARMRGYTIVPDAGQPLPVTVKDPLVWLVNRLQTDDDGDPLMEGIFSNYNDDIVLEADTNTLVGRFDPARGPAQALVIGDGLRIEDGVLIGEGGGEKGDPGPVGPVGPPGPEGPAGASSSMWLYRFDSATQAMDPGAGRIRYNNSDPTQATRIYFDRLTQDGLDPTIAFTTATFEDEFVIQRRGLSAQNITFRLMAPAIDRTDWFEVWVQYVGHVGASFSNNMEITVILRTRGQPGPIGPQGIQGPVGPQGPIGLRGPTGDTGPTGPTGMQGVKGDKGDQGYTGATGAKGDQGIQGIKGDTGNQGPKGDKGDQGVIGPRGETGPQGEQGIQGEVGPPGDFGDNEAPYDGKTYGRKDGLWSEIVGKIYVQSYPPSAAMPGEFWFEDDSGILWLRMQDVDSTQWVQVNGGGGVGSQGIQGEVGPAGPQGPQGETGEVGPQGVQGPIGNTGPQGPQGIQGVQGPAGGIGEAPTDGKTYGRKSSTWSEVVATATAATTTFAPAGNVAATNVQTAIAELDTEKLALAGGTLTGALIAAADPTANLGVATKQYVDSKVVQVTQAQYNAGPKTAGVLYVVIG